MQIFVRGRQGIKNLAELVALLEEREFPFREHARVLHEIQAVLAEMRGIKKADCLRELCESECWGTEDVQRAVNNAYTTLIQRLRARSTTDSSTE